MVTESTCSHQFFAVIPAKQMPPKLQWFKAVIFQLVCHSIFLKMQYLTIQSGELTSSPLDCQIKK